MKQSDATTLLAALAHEHRLSVFKCLMRHGPNGLAAGDIARTLQIAPTSLSFHLKELANVGLVHSWRDGRFVRYAVEIDAMRDLLNFLTHDCCNGDPRLCGADLASAQQVCAEDEENLKEGNATEQHHE